MKRNEGMAGERRDGRREIKECRREMRDVQREMMGWKEGYDGMEKERGRDGKREMK